MKAPNLSKKFILLSLLLLSLLIFVQSNKHKTNNSKENILESANTNIPDQSLIQGTMNYNVLKISEHRSTVYTQGLILTKDGKHLYESGGLYYKSTISKLSYPSLQVEYEKKLAGKYFGEGIARCGNILYQLTWMERDILMYNANDLSDMGKIKMDLNMRQGWGLTEFSKNILLGTDGSNEIFFLDCNNKLKMKHKISAKFQGQPLDRLNDLVFVNGYIYMNRYYDKHIYKINPVSGLVEKTWDMGPLIRYELQQGILTESLLNGGNVLNGITYDEKRKIFILTGKYWGFFYEVALDD